MSPTSLPHHRPLTPDDFAQARASIAPLQKALDACRARRGAASFTVAWMSDIHLHAPRPYDGDMGFYGNRVDCSANFRLALAELAALTPLPDLLVLGGDLADGGCGGEAPGDEFAELGRLLRAALPPGLPTLAISGNHDHADRPLSAAWHRAWHAAAPHPWPVSPDSDDYYFAHRLGGWRIIGLDSRQNHPLSAPQRAWLANELVRDPATPTLVLVHRPLLTVGNWVDDFRLQDRATFDLLDAAPAVRAVWSGHTHLPRAWRYRGKKHVIFPALAYGIPGPCGWGVGVFSRDRLEALFVKPLAGPWFDGVAFTSRLSARQVRRLPFRAYTAHPLYNPCLLPADKR
jgi:3',5'-cyclic AMP phosphodiesterase CpdA